MRSELANPNKAKACRHPHLRRALMGNSQVQPLVAASRPAAVAHEPLLSPEAMRYALTMLTAFVVLVGHFVTDIASF